VLMFQPLYTHEQVLGHYLLIDDAVRDGHDFRRTYINKFQPFIAEQLWRDQSCRFRVLTYQVGLNTGREIRVVHPVLPTSDPGIENGTSRTNYGPNQ
jgi:hypothetical protein